MYLWISRIALNMSKYFYISQSIISHKYLIVDVTIYDSLTSYYPLPPWGSKAEKMVHNNINNELKSTAKDFEWE